MKCTNKCEHWYFNLRIPAGTGPMCKKYELPILKAKEYCLMDAEERRKRSNEPNKQEMVKRENKSRKISAAPWPGSLRGWGPITKEAGI